MLRLDAMVGMTLSLDPTPPLYRKIAACRSCGCRDLWTVFDFGEPYISDFIEPDDPAVPPMLRPSYRAPRAPLEVVCCRECGLAQLRHTVDRDLLYRERYWYRSGTNESMVEALHDVVMAARGEPVSLSPGDRVLDIGANDGTLLRQYPNYLEKWAVEPSRVFFSDLAAALAPVDDQLMNYHYAAYWPPVQYPSCHNFDGKLFKIITSIACFYDADDPGAFVDAIKDHLHKDGVWIVQLQGAADVAQHNGIDYWCHEHLCCWSTQAFWGLLNAHGLTIQHVERVPVNGGSLRFTVGHSEYRGLWQPRDLPGAEWRKFGATAVRLRDEALALLERLHAEGKRVLGVAASTKANTLLQCYGIDSGLLSAIVERAPEKIGKVTVGSHIPIISEADGDASRPDYYVALAWHFLDGLRARHPTVPFITFLPEVKIWPALSEA